MAKDKSLRISEDTDPGVSLVSRSAPAQRVVPDPDIRYAFATERRPGGWCAVKVAYRAADIIHESVVDLRSAAIADVVQELSRDL